MEGASLAPGFRFHPTDDELVMYYLKRKVLGKKFRVEAISELNIYKFVPWDLPDKSCLRSNDLEWYFFCPREKKYASGSRMNRKTEAGYWKSTGKDRHVLYHKIIVGTVRTLVFHIGRAPRGERTNWVLYEYRLEDRELADAGIVQDAYVICKVFQKSGLGPNNGAQYGAPFNEEDWNDEDVCAESLPSDRPALSLCDNQKNSIVTDTSVPKSTPTWSCCEPSQSSVVPPCNKVSSDVHDYDKEICAESFPSDGATVLLLENQENSVVTSTIVPEGACNWSYFETDSSSVVPPGVQDDDIDSLFAAFCEDNSPTEINNNIWSYSQMGPSSAVPPSVVQNHNPPIENNNNIWPYSQAGPSSAVPPFDVQGNDDVALLLAQFTEDDLPVENDNNKELRNLVCDKSTEALNCTDQNAICNGLGDQSEFNFSSFSQTGNDLNPMFLYDNAAYLDEMEPDINMSLNWSWWCYKL